jgi:hypothetical protein
LWLTPPSSLGQVTVVDIATAVSATEHDQQVRAWAESAWSAWAEHHDTIRRWADNLLNP